jgi:hypothetical protein
LSSAKKKKKKDRVEKGGRDMQTCLWSLYGQAFSLPRPDPLGSNILLESNKSFWIELLTMLSRSVDERGQKYRLPFWATHLMRFNSDILGRLKGGSVTNNKGWFTRFCDYKTPNASLLLCI